MMKSIVDSGFSSLICPSDRSFETPHIKPLRSRRKLSATFPRSIAMTELLRSPITAGSRLALSEQAQSARLKLRADRRKAQCSGSPTEVDDHSSSPSSSAISLELSLFLPLSLSVALPLLLVLSFSPFNPTSPLHPLLFLIPLSICLSIYLRRRSLFIAPPHRPASL